MTEFKPGDKVWWKSSNKSQKIRTKVKGIVDYIEGEVAYCRLHKNFGVGPVGSRNFPNSRRYKKLLTDLKPLEDRDTPSEQAS